MLAGVPAAHSTKCVKLSPVPVGNLQEELVCSDPVLARGLALVSVDEAAQSLASASLDMYALPEDEWVCAVDEDAQVHKSRVAAFLKKNLRVGG